MPESSRIEELRRRVQVDPASIAFAALAEEYRRSGRFDEAIATCEQGLHWHPSYVPARVTLGRALLQIGRDDDARIEFERALRRAPGNLAASRGLAEIPEQKRPLPERIATRAASIDAAPAARMLPPDEAAVAALDAFLRAVLRTRARDADPSQPRPTNK